MNLFKAKEIKHEDTPQEKKCLELLDQIHEAWRQIEVLSQRSYVTTEALKCYRSGTPDYSYQVRRIDEVQSKLICRIGEYDDLRSQFFKVRENTRFYDRNVSESHIVVESALTRLFH